MFVSGWRIVYRGVEYRGFRTEYREEVEKRFQIIELARKSAEDGSPPFDDDDLFTRISAEINTLLIERCHSGIINSTPTTITSFVI